jgi:hypothetical protein
MSSRFPVNQKDEFTAIVPVFPSAPTLMLLGWRVNRKDSPEPELAKSSSNAEADPVPPFRDPL